MIPPKASFFGIPISIYQRDELDSFIKNSIECSLRRVIYGFSFHSIYNIPHIPEIVGLGKEADLILSDGRPFYWLLKFFKIPVKSNTSIPESVLTALDIANKYGYSVFLLGSTSELNKTACDKIKCNYPNINNVNGSSGYFDLNDDINKVLNNINAKKPDILLIGISSPKKEIIAFNHKHKLNAGLIIPCGGMIDVLAGKTKITPPFIKAIGLASLYRSIQEPRRLLPDRLKIYWFVAFRLMPVLMANHYFKKNKDFSIWNHFRNKQINI